MIQLLPINFLPLVPLLLSVSWQTEVTRCGGFTLINVSSSSEWCRAFYALFSCCCVSHPSSPYIHHPPSPSLSLSHPPSLPSPLVASPPMFLVYLTLHHTPYTTQPFLHSITAQHRSIGSHNVIPIKWLWKFLRLCEKQQ